MNCRSLLRPLVLAALLLAPAPALAQAAPQVRLLPESRVWVEGTSNRDNWTVNAANVDGHVVLGTGAMRIERGRFRVAAGAMDGGKGPIMNRLMYNSLKSDEHPDIVYELTSLEATPAAEGRFRLSTRGKVTIAGVTRDIEGPAEVERVAGGNLRFTGSHALQMSDFGITAPTAMFGALRTGDRVVVHFDLLVRP